MDSAAARLIEPLFPRPQDFEIAVVWVDAPRSPIPPAGTLTPTIVASGATFTVPQFQFPDYPEQRVLRGFTSAYQHLRRH